MAARVVLSAAALCALVSQPANAGPIVPVRPLYLVPSDRAPNTDYAAAIDAALLDLQSWFAGELGGLTIDIASDVDILSTTHPASFYSTTPHPFPVTDFDFFFNVLDEATTLGVWILNDPFARWAVYIDADPAPGQSGGAATAGVTIIAAADLRGLIGLEPAPPSRWIGGLGHELGHTFGLPHPLDVRATRHGLWVSVRSVELPAERGRRRVSMQFGYLTYPNTYLLSEEQQFLASTPYVGPQDDGPATVPEPGTLTLTLLGLLTTGSLSRKKLLRETVSNSGSSA